MTGGKLNPITRSPASFDAAGSKFAWRSMSLGLTSPAMKHAVIALVISAAIAGSGRAENEPGFVRLFDGETFTGWRPAIENSNTWRIEDGALVTRGQRCHLFYVGDDMQFTNFHLKVEVMTEPDSNGGIYFHTQYQADGWPKRGFESQVNCTQGDWIKTGSLYGLVNLGATPARDQQWWTQEIKVEGRKITVLVDGAVVLQYIEPPGAQPGRDYERKLGAGTFALQAHDPKSVVRYRNLRVKRLD